MHYIYKITNLINSKIYIGQAKNTNQRWRQHQNESKKDKPSMVINYAMKKYGIENFKFEVIASCLDQDAANNTETIIIQQENSYAFLNKGYNVSNGGSNAPKTEEWKRKVVATRRAKDNYKHSDETKRKIAMANTGENYHGLLKPGHSIRNTGKTHFKSGQIFPNTGRVMPNNVKQKLLEANKGRKLSQEHKNKLSEIKKNKYHNGSFKNGASPHNKIQFTEQQTSDIKNDSRSLVAIAVDYNVTPKVISRVKKNL